MVARDARRFRDAAILYEQALHLVPRRVNIQVQAGHMFKEAGDLAAAERHYLAALTRLPDDADLALQLGHFYKIARRDEDAISHYRRALVLNPNESPAAAELKAFDRLAAHGAAALLPTNLDLDDGIIPELLPEFGGGVTSLASYRIDWLRLGGRRLRTDWGVLPVLSGIEAVRGVYTGDAKLDTAVLRIGDAVIAQQAIEPLVLGDGLARYAFNLWCDVSSVAPGLQSVRVTLSGGRDTVERREEHVVVEPPRREADHPESDGIVDDIGSGADLESRIRSRPSMIRPAGARFLPSKPGAILVLRPDQIGDLVVSVPALSRLRELFPQARLIGLVSHQNVDLARTMDMFDELVVAAFDENQATGRRVMTREDQARLRRDLHAYGFDIAIDLAAGGASRLLLHLSGAKLLCGFHEADWPWLDIGMTSGTHDVANNLEAAPQSAQILALIERLATLARTRATTMRPTSLDRAVLAPLGVADGKRFLVLHTGARLPLSRWPGYRELARLLVERTDLVIVLMTDEPAILDDLEQQAALAGRLILVTGKLPFEQFDALLSFCAVFVGNDSGPKHLAALRGVPVASLHCARLNWSEWGQEQTGIVISRRVPCAGCAISTRADECGRNFVCVTDIGPEEVFDSVIKML